MKNILFLPLCCVIAACSMLHGGDSYQEQLQQWVGRPEYQLYQVWGYPAQSFYVTPYEKVAVYVRTSDSGHSNPYDTQLYYQGMDGEDSWWDKLFGPPSEQQAENYYCKTTFTIKNGMIANFGFNGDNCTINN